MSSRPQPPTDTQALIRRSIGLCRMMRAWPAGVLDELSAVARLGRYERHEQILADDPQRREVLVVASGCVVVDSVDASGARFLLAMFGPGDITGLVRLLEDTRFVYHFHAREPTVLVHVPGGALRGVLDAHPALWRDVCLLMLQRQQQQIVARRRGTLSHLGRQLADTVVQIAHSHGVPARDAAGVSVPVSQSDLAAMLSVSRQTINKELRLLEQRGLLHAEYGRLAILDLPGLEQMAQGALHIDPWSSPNQKENKL
ncbi:MAG: Crp/Fnr family transcriptional regulator [Ottowia sp.]|uniref:Crp/Fnr family transcriptional regulator n=1 Tax=Ottowia sp. TaxID=1898956 RepID=UPI0039E2F2E0